MLKFKKATIQIKGVETKGYTVEGLDDTVFRGLQITVVRNGKGWLAYEATTGIELTPPSWAGSYSNKTREGVLQIIANMFKNVFPQVGWEWLQDEIDYDLQ